MAPHADHVVFGSQLGLRHLHNGHAVALVDLALAALTLQRKSAQVVVGVAGANARHHVSRCVFAAGRGAALAYNGITFVWLLLVMLPYRLIQWLIYKVQMFRYRRRLRRQSLANR